MVATPTFRQSAELESFQCLAGKCEDTCCTGFSVAIDRATYEKYQHCKPSELQSRLQQYVNITPANRTDEDFARISFTSGQCPFLTENLCAVQLEMGEPYLSNTCRNYPRALNTLDGVPEWSLHLSCPEAARLVLSNQHPSAGNAATPAAVMQTASGPVLETKSYPLFQQVRDLFLSVLRARQYSLSQRLQVLGQLAEEFNAIQPGGDAVETGHFLWHSLATLHDGTFPPANIPTAPESLQLETVVELIVTRIGSEYTAPRFVECYRDFMQGLHWGPDSTMPDLLHRFADARSRYFEPFIAQHPYLLENLLVNYGLQNVFPYGHREIDQKLRIDFVENSVRRQYLLLIAHYASIRVLLIGIAALHQEKFGTEQVLKVIQSYSKAFFHSGAYPAQALKILAGNGIQTASAAFPLFRDL